MKAREKVDVLIAGAGPAGLSVALHLARDFPELAEHLVVVERAHHPRLKLCGGGITPWSENVLAGLGLAVEVPHVKVRQAILRNQDQEFMIRGRPLFRVVQRCEFDHALARHAEAAGIRIAQDEDILGMVRGDNAIEVETPERRFEAKVVVGADGAASVVRRTFWDEGPAKIRLSGLMEAVVPADRVARDAHRTGTAFFDFSSDRSGIQGYYWEFPCLRDGEAGLNCGVFDSRITPRDSRPSLHPLLLEEMRIRRGLTEIPTKGWPLRWYDRHAEIGKPRVLLVGDASGVDPLLGEGVGFALAYGAPAAEAIGHAFATNDYSFSSYRRRVSRHRYFRPLHARVLASRLIYGSRTASSRYLWWSLLVWLAHLRTWTPRPLAQGEKH